MIFGNKKIDKDMNICVGINGISIDRVYNTTFLGVTIHDKLNWKEHIKMMPAKRMVNCGHYEATRSRD